MLVQNKYFIIPVVNVDGVSLIESHWLKTGNYLEKRKNMNPKYKEICKGSAEYGVDLNRNYGVFWSKPGGNSADPCADNFRGEHPFSEPETRAIRDFLYAHKHEIKFVYNFHAYANMWLWPYNGQTENTIGLTNPEVLSIFKEFMNETNFPKHILTGNAFDSLGYISSGEQSDWILGELGIPSICPEIGSSDMFAYNFTLPYRKNLVDILLQNIDWMEHTYKIIGNHFRVEPLSYHLSSSLNRTGGPANFLVTIQLKVSNLGLSDQILQDFEIVLKSHHQGPDHVIKVRGLKARSHQIVSYTLPVPQEAAL